GRDTALSVFLAALVDERSGRPARAVSELERAADRFSPKWEGMVQLTRGRCYEALWDDMKALEAYTRAMQVDPAAVVPRLAIAKLRLKRRPDLAIDELKRGLAVVPTDPGLRVALAGALLREQATLPPKRRSWSEYDAAFRRAIEVAKGNSALVLMN